MHAIAITDHHHTTSRTATYPAYYLGRPVRAYQHRYGRDVAAGRGRR